MCVFEKYKPLWVLEVANDRAFPIFQGLWGALNNTSSSDLNSLENVSHAPKKPTTVVVDVSEEIPRAFGQGRGRGFGGRNAGQIMKLTFLRYLNQQTCTDI